MDLWRRPAILVAITAVLMLAGGLAAGWAIGSAAPGDDSPEAGFYRDMQTHHQQAVEMAMYEWRNGHDESMRSIAYDIATAQSAEIGMMRSALREWGVQMTSGDLMGWVDEQHAAEMIEADGLMAGMATDEEMNEFKTLTGTDSDIAFANMMIDHHIGGIAMAEVYLDLGDDPVVTDAAKRMVQVQRTEIEAMEAHLDRIESNIGA